MIITTPIYFIRIEGDLKHIVCELPDVVIATYEEDLNKTYVVLKASDENKTKDVIKYFYNLHDDLKKHKKQFKKEQVEVRYSKEGINFKIA